jgi:hypothetical protein
MTEINHASVNQGQSSPSFFNKEKVLNTIEAYKADPNLKTSQLK